MCCGYHRPVGVADQASELSRDGILQHRLGQTGIRNQPFEVGVLILELAQTLHL